MPVGVLINGEPASTVSAQDRGLHYGDGLFETVAVRRGRVLQWERHMARLKEGCDRLGMSAPLAELKEEAERLCLGMDAAVLKVIVTRGAGGRGYGAALDGDGTRIVAVYPWSEYPPDFRAQGVRVRVCRTRIGTSPALAGLKHLNRLEQVLARREWQDPAIVEGLMLDHEGYVIEGTRANLFMVRAGELFTSDLSRCGVAGITRARILEHAATQGIRYSVTRIRLEEVMRADEVFLCNSLIGIWPVGEIDAARFPVGALTREIVAYLDQEATA
jgi:4-amino-4-deoxychorismate lyase